MSKQKEEQSAAVETQEQAAQGGLLDKIINVGMRPRDESQAQRSRDIIADFVKQAMQGQMVLDKNLETTINARIAEIDRLISSQLNEVMHHDAFQQLEGSWRGLHHLVFESETGTMLKVRVLNVTKK